jgi:hypothetical protein
MTHRHSPWSVRVVQVGQLSHPLPVLRARDKWGAGKQYEALLGTYVGANCRSDVVQLQATCSSNKRAKKDRRLALKVKAKDETTCAPGPVKVKHETTCAPGPALINWKG